MPPTSKYVTLRQATNITNLAESQIILDRITVGRLKMRGGKSPRLVILTISLLRFFCYISCLLQSQ